MSRPVARPTSDPSSNARWADVGFILEFGSSTLLRMEITVNDEVKDVPEGATITQLLELLKFRPRYVAVERNRELIPRAEHANCTLQSGDRIEVVTLVGGG